MIIPYNNKKPSIDDSVFVAPGAHLIGDISIGKNSTIWFNAVLRGDEDSITIGEKCSIQDNSTIHLFEGCPVVIENEVTVGHNVILHGCKIGKRSIIGMGSTILDNVEIGEECIVGANTLISSGKIIPPRSLVIGTPGKVVRRLNDKDLELIQLSIDTYVQKGKDFKGILD
ncbi:gamma carbonic anhydrase family protein [Peribacillus frigoritolerans]|uniref:gamma carbonic anhydrase family protein n=1 Tax=Peribacillus frigoritolerans TaxID=450367 RepID=UPI00207A4A48|nr:gamma carbonic anhydrase family protein [Peribacillus frigoritolerans]USK75990.1 gamma carbonic anhydrase family protein [Peribacillus frigoritolerans]